MANSNLLSVHLIPVQPRGQRQWPSLDLHLPCWHLQCWVQLTPKVPCWQGVWQNSPCHPGIHWHIPVTWWHSPPFLQLQWLAQFKPYLLGGQGCSQVSPIYPGRHTYSPVTWSHVILPLKNKNKKISEIQWNVVNIKFLILLKYYLFDSFW